MTGRVASPDLLRDVGAGRCVRTVFVTAGDAAERVGGTADQRSVYWHAREAGSRAAYALMSGVSNSWDRSHVLVDGHRIVMFTLVANPKVSLMFLRLPDGNPDGSGSRFHNHESLVKLRAGQMKVMHAIDGSTSYTKSGLLATVTELVVSYHPDVIRAQDYASPDYSVTVDHSDHTTTAIVAHAASDAYQAPHAFIGYLDYNVEQRPANVGGRDLAAKRAAFYAYDRHDSQLPCYTQALRTSGPKASECATYAVWLQRSYRISFTPSWNQPCLVPGVGGELLLDAEEIIRAVGCSVADVRDSDDQVLSPTEWKTISERWSISPHRQPSQSSFLKGHRYRSSWSPLGAPPDRSDIGLGNRGGAETGAADLSVHMDEQRERRPLVGERLQRQADAEGRLRA